MAHFDYSGRVAIVTGASSGIGRDVAIGFARRGARVIVVARREERLAGTLDEIRQHVPECESVVADVGDPETARRAVSLAREKFGRLDFLVNNAGVSKRKHILDVTREDVDQAVRTNLLGAMYFVLEALPLMVERQEGWIVNVSSIAGRLGNPKESVYSATKFGVTGFTEALYYDLHRRGIRTITIHPGPIATEIWETVETPAAYKGKLWPVEDVTRAIFHSIEHGKLERTVPRIMGLVPVLKALFPPLVRLGTDRFDRDRPDRD